MQASDFLPQFAERFAAKRDGGMGLAARPVGAYVIRNSDVKWKPAFDLSRAIIRRQIVVLTALLVGAWILHARGKAH